MDAACEQYRVYGQSATKDSPGSNRRRVCRNRTLTSAFSIMVRSKEGRSIRNHWRPGRCCALCMGFLPRRQRCSSNGPGR